MSFPGDIIRKPVELKVGNPTLRETTLAEELGRADIKPDTRKPEDYDRERKAIKEYSHIKTRECIERAIARFKKLEEIEAIRERSLK